MPRGEVLLESPPELPEVLPKSLGRLLQLLPAIAGAGALAFLYAGRGGGPITYIAGGLFGVSMLGAMLGSFGGGGADEKAELNAERRDYMRYLAQVRRQVRRASKQQRQSLTWRHPAPDALWSVISGSRLWERRVNDDDFGELRIAVGPQRLAVKLVTPETKPVEDLEPMSAVALRRFVRTYTTVPELPVALSMRAFGRIIVQGDRTLAMNFVRAMVSQATAFHSPDDLWVSVCSPYDRWNDWEWCKWLPHALRPGGGDVAGPGRRVAESLEELENEFDELLAGRSRHSPNNPPVTDQPHLFVVLDGGEITAECQLVGGGLQGATVIDMSGVVPRDVTRSTLVLRLETDSAGKPTVSIVSRTGPSSVGTPDQLSWAQADGMARQLAPYRMSQVTGGDEPLSVATELPELLGIGEVGALTPAITWRPRPNRERLRIPIGLSPDGLPVDLDFKESAQEGMGPHGLLIGATGSGKSELLRTLVAGLAITHSSETLNFVLVDFKGGATFAPLVNLPHTSAVITNLADELHLVDRMQDALNGEMVRRQEMLRAAGNYSSVRDYERARLSGVELEPLPSLLVVCDEFSELLSAKPDFIDIFVQIGRLGRSLGVHLLLASQRLEEGKLRGLDTHLSYRIGLRTFSAVESRIVLGVPDAYELPSAPGHGYLKIDTQTMIRFRAAYVSGPYVAPGVTPSAGRVAAAAKQVVPYTLAPVLSTSDEDDPPDAGPDDERVGETLLDVVVRRLVGQGPPAHQVWLPPLDEPPTLDDVLPPLSVDPNRGLCPAGWEGLGRLTVPVGVVDRPFDQRRDILWAQLDGAAGHVVVIGGPQSGKSTMLRALVSSLALTHTPREVQFFVLDFGGGAFSGLRGLPHIGGVAARTEIEVVRRVVAEVNTVLDDREKRFADLGIDSIVSYRRRRAAGEFADDPFGDVFLVIDGWGTIRQEYEDLEQTITQIAARGLGYGVHVILSAARYMELRANIRDLLGTKLELRLGDPSESEVDRRTAQNVPAGSPGRGLSAQKLHFLSALPRIDGQRGADDLSQGVVEMVRGVAEGWRSDPAPRVRLLPTILDISQLPPADDPAGLPIGINESQLKPVALDFAADSHFLVFGDSECGKSAFLRHVLKSLVKRHTPNDARILIADYRRSLLGAIETDHVIGYAASSATLQPMINDVKTAMTQRLPGADLTAEQLRNRTWWEGPDLYIVVDDYDLVVTPSGNPIAALLEFIPQATDIGLHLIIARRSGGAGRAIYEPVIQRIKEIGSPGIVMSGNRDEGALLGNVRPSSQPPGRGTMVRRKDGTQLVQLAYCPPD